MGINPLVTSGHRGRESESKIDMKQEKELTLVADSGLMEGEMCFIVAE